MMNKISKDEHSLFVFIPYLYGTTFFGSQIHPERTILIPCLHDEGYAKMSLVKDMIKEVKGICFNSFPEQELAKTLYDEIPQNIVTGEGIDLSSKNIDSVKFKEKYNLTQFILCASRKESGKNIPLLIKYFSKYLENNNTDLKLILTGKGDIEIPQNHSKNILSVYLSKEELHTAYASAVFFCLPSINESFSRVIMESWLNSTPILVHERCPVTKFHCLESNGGLYFDTFDEFKNCIDFFLNNDDMRKQLGLNGKTYVLENFTWEKVINNYDSFLKSVF